MPFTFSHPAIILPLTRVPQRYYSLTGLIAGAVVPDFEYFFRMDIYSRYSHTLEGLFYFNLPVGILLCFVFHGLVKRQFIAGLPRFFQTRSGPLLNLNWPAAFRRHFLIISISIVIGAASHLFWDGFTHGTGYFVDLIGYKAVYFFVFGLKVRLYNFLQHLGTVTGLVFIYFYIKKMPADGLVQAGGIRYVYWGLVLLFCAVITAIRLLTSGTGPDAFGKIILTLISGFLIGMVLVPFIYPQNSDRRSVATDC